VEVTIVTVFTFSQIMKVAFIVNPVSGRGRQKGIERIIPKYFDDYLISFTQKTGDATELSKNAIESGAEMVVAVGGDGTLNECVKAVINTDCALAVIPCGSGNGFANHIKMSKNIDVALNQIAKSQVTQVDAGEVNGEIFINVAGVGFDAILAQKFNELTERGVANYIRLVVNELSYTPKSYTIRHGEIERTIEAYMITCCNATQFGNDARICPSAKIDDGVLDFVIVRSFPQFQIAEFILRLMSGTLTNCELVEIVQAESMKIISNDQLVHLDGEPCVVGKTVSVNVMPQSIKVAIPVRR